MLQLYDHMFSDTNRFGHPYVLATNTHQSTAAGRHVYFSQLTCFGAIANKYIAWKQWSHLHLAMPTLYYLWQINVEI